MTLALPEGVELIADVSTFSSDLLRLEAEASRPYSTFVYEDERQAQRISRMLFDANVAEFSAPASELLLNEGNPAGLLVALDDSLLRRRRLGSAKHVVRSGELERHPDVGARLQQAGSTLHQPISGDWYLSRIAIAASARGRGFGGLLLQHFLAAGIERGLRRAVLEVDPASTSAVRLYEAAGFRTAGEREVIDASGTRRLHYRIMTKAL